MKIALTSSLSRTIQKSAQGGTETFVYLLAEQLTGRGHDVDVYTVLDSVVPGNKITVLEKPYKEEGQTLTDTKIARQTALKEIAGAYRTFKLLAQKYHQYDIVHNNQCDFYSIIQTAKMPRGLTTMHIPMDDFTINLAALTDPTFKAGKYIAISDFQVKTGRLPFIGRIYNGIDLKDFSFNPKPEEYLTWLGRISTTKGLLEALTLTAETQTRFTFAGTIWDQEYFDKVSQLIDKDRVKFIGHADPTKRNTLLGNAKAFLFPLQWDEPFGLIFIEAMACGTPIIAYDRGAVREIVVDGVTGFICPPNDKEAMKAAIRKILAMPEKEYGAMRMACRKRVEEYFTIERMANQYESIYQKIIHQHS